jgi:hypothetical protein
MAAYECAHQYNTLHEITWPNDMWATVHAVRVDTSEPTDVADTLLPYWIAWIDAQGKLIGNPDYNPYFMGYAAEGTYGEEVTRNRGAYCLVLQLPKEDKEAVIRAVENYGQQVRTETLELGGGADV